MPDVRPQQKLPSRWIEVQSAGSCPCCYSSHTLVVQKPSSVLMKVLGGVMVKCGVCTQLVCCADIKVHVESGCTRKPEGPPDLTVSRILNQPLTTPPTPTERQLASNLVRRMMAATSSDSIQIATGGQVNNYNSVT